MDIRLHYTEKGTGEPLILLHGNGENSGYFVHQIDFFSQKYRGHSGGYGAGTENRREGRRRSGSVSLQRILRDFMDELEIERANILGFSDGGNIAVTFALK